MILPFQARNEVLCSYKASIETINFEYPFDEIKITEITSNTKATAPPGLFQTVEIFSGIISLIPGIIRPKIACLKTISYSARIGVIIESKISETGINERNKYKA